MTQAPTITTARLTLRHHVMSDFAPFHNMMRSDRARFMGGPFSREDSWKVLASEVGAWSLQSHGSWAVDRQEDGAFIGQVSITKPAHYPEVEIGWALLEGFEGHGYMTEAARAALDWAWATLPADTLVSYITPGNDGSVGVAERLGAVLDTTASIPEGETPEETIVYRHRRPAREVLQ